MPELKLTTLHPTSKERGLCFHFCNTNAATKVKKFKRLPLETNKQNWSLHKVGNTYSVSFGLIRGRKKRIPLTIHQANHAPILEALLNGNAEPGSIKLWRSKKGIWFALLSVSMEVPDSQPKDSWVGVDRGQRHLAVASLPTGLPKFWTFGHIRQIRRRYQKLRQQLQSAKKRKTVKKLESKERRIITHINHIVSKQIVQFAAQNGCGIRLEDLSGIRQTSKQRKKNKSDAGNNRDAWSYYQLESFVEYKALWAGIPVEKVPPPYTSKSCCRCGGIGKRNKHSFSCPRCSYHVHADWNASQNIGHWLGFSCSLVLQQGSSVMGASVQGSGVNDTPPNSVSELAGSARSTSKNENPTA